MEMSDNDLRIKGITRNRQIFFLVNGKEFPAFEGETVFGALYAAGFNIMGQRNYGQQERCGFCGMGLCYECLVTVNGRKNQRACMVEVEPNMEIIIDAD